MDFLSANTQLVEERQALKIWRFFNSPRDEKCQQIDRMLLFTSTIMGFETQLLNSLKDASEEEMKCYKAEIGNVQTQFGHLK